MSFSCDCLVDFLVTWIQAKFKVTRDDKIQIVFTKRLAPRIITSCRVLPFHDFARIMDPEQYMPTVADGKKSSVLVILVDNEPPTFVLFNDERLRIKVQSVILNGQRRAFAKATGFSRAARLLRSFSTPARVRSTSESRQPLIPIE